MGMLKLKREMRRKLDDSLLKALREQVTQCSLFWSLGVGRPGLPISLRSMANLSSLKTRAEVEHLSNCSEKPEPELVG